MGQYSTSDRAMREYLSALLEEEQESTELDDLALQTLDQLVQTHFANPEMALETEPAVVSETSESTIDAQDTVAAQETVQTAPEKNSEREAQEEVSVPQVKQEEPQESSQVDPALEVQPVPEAQLGGAQPPTPPDLMAEYQQSSFQALFFTVAGLNLAVPLKSLGGIHKWEAPKPLFGQPDWFLGMMTLREEQLRVVDSALWVMPEKYDDILAQSLNYQYLVMLGESTWGLACETLVSTIAIEPDEVKWRQSNSKRPWLAGIVKDKMCALLNVDALIKLLDQGLNNNNARSD